MPCFVQKLLLLVATAISAGAFSHTFDDIPHLKVCGDAIDWRPYIYQEGDQAGGFDAEVLERVLTQHGISYEFVITSWSRCLKGTKNGSYDLSVSASYNEAREQDYLYTEWYYTITPYYLFSTKRFPDGLFIADSTELENYRVCGNHNYNYSNFGLAQVDVSAHTIQQSLNQLETGECDVYLSWEEILAGNNTPRGESYLGKEIMSMAMPNMEPHKFYMLISRQLESAQTLKQLLDEQFLQIRELH